MLLTFEAQPTRVGCEMQTIKLMGAFAALMFSGVGLAQTTFECGNVACVGNDPLNTV
jgi:hypothetical protein